MMLYAIYLQKGKDLRQTSSPNAPSCKSRETETLATTLLLFGKDSPHHWQYSHSPAVGYTHLYQTIYIKLFRPEIPDFANSSAMTLKGFKRFVEVLACNDPALAHTCPFAEVVLLSASRTLPPAQNCLSPGREEGIPSTTAVWRQRLCKTLLKQHQTLLWYPCDRECFHWFLQVLIQSIFNLIHDIHGFGRLDMFWTLGIIMVTWSEEV